MIRIFAALLLALVVGCSHQANESKISLSQDELKFIAARPTVTWAMENNRPPYIFVEDGSANGLSPAYLDLIAKKTGLKFRPVLVEGYNAAIDDLRGGKVDIVTAVRPTPELSKHFGFTPPFAYQAGVFAFRVNTRPRSPMTTGITKNSPAKKYLQSRFPEMNLIETVDDEQSISLLEKGLLDGSVTDKGSAKYLTTMSGFEIRSAIINFDFPFSFAYRQDDLILGSIMTKAVSSISTEEKARMNEKWLKEK